MKMIDKYSSSLLAPKKITKGDLDTLADVARKFLEKEAAQVNKNIKPKDKGKLNIEDPNSLGKFLEDTIAGSEYELIKDGRLRFDTWHKAAGDGKAVPKKNLWFIIDPKLKSVEFRANGGISDKSFNYKDFKDLVSSIRDIISYWKKEDKARYDDMRYQAWKLDR